MQEDETVGGIPFAQWAASFRPGMPEFAATHFTFTREAKDLVRIAFGNNGPPVAEGHPRQPVFTHAVTLPPEIAVQLAGLLLKFYAEPEGERSTTSGEV